MKQIALVILAFAISCGAVISCKKDHDANESSGCAATEALIYKEGATTLMLPTAFTPNNDGLNDVFRAVYKNIDTAIFELTIVRGNDGILFHATSISEAWNGKSSNGQEAPSGAYNVSIRYKTASGRIVDTCNTLTLFKYDVTTGCLHTNGKNYRFEDDLDPVFSGYKTAEKICP